MSTGQHSESFLQDDLSAVTGPLHARLPAQHKKEQ